MTKEAERRLIEAARELEQAGYKRTSLYELLRDNLDSSNWEERLRVKSIKHINIFIDILEGMRPRDIKDKYEIKTFNKKEALYKGYKKIRKTLGLTIDLSDAPLTEGEVNRQWWTEKAREALGALEEKAPRH